MTERLRYFVIEEMGISEETKMGRTKFKESPTSLRKFEVLQKAFKARREKGEAAEDRLKKYRAGSYVWRKN